MGDLFVSGIVKFVPLAFSQITTLVY